MTNKVVLVPLDGSQEAEAALAYAATLALAEEAAMHLLAVVDTASEGNLVPRGVRAEWQQTEWERAQRYLEGKVSLLRGQGCEAVAEVASGKVAGEILRAADADNASMIVMATHGRSGLERSMMGSVADKVMRTSRRPTLLIRPPTGASPASPAVLKRIAVPLDGSDLAEQALGPAGDLAASLNAELLLVRVEQWLFVSATRWGGEVGYMPNLEEADQEIAANARAYLVDAQRRLPAATRSEAFVLRGFAALELDVFFKQERVDLLVMTTHGRSGLARMALGSTADRLVHEGLPILLVPAMETADLDAPAAVTTGRA
jgi:nucleotide-binding universal stress UspA family protein